MQLDPWVLLIALVLGVWLGWVLNGILRGRILSQQLRQLTDQAGEREEQLSRIRAQNDQLQRQVTGASAQSDQLQQELTRVGAQYDQLQQELAQIHAENDQLQQELTRVGAQNDQLQQEVTRVSGQNDQLHHELTRVGAQNDQLQQELVLAADARSALENERQSTDARAAQLEIELARAQREQDASEALMAGLEAEKVKLESRIENLDLHLSEVVVERDRLTADLEAVRAQQAIPAGAVAPDKRSEDDDTPYTAVRPQPLAEVKGVGTAFQQYLYEAGIGSYWDLARLTDAELARLLRLTGPEASAVDLSALRADARRLARQTRSLGRTWARCPVW